MKQHRRIVASLVLAMFFASACSEIAKEEKFYLIDTKEFAPIENIGISAMKDTSITFKSGTVLNIPAETFIRKDGKAVEGAVTIEFQEVHSLGELYAAGVPMLFQEEDGKVGQMLSSGMFDLEAKDASGAELAIAKGKHVDVKLTCQANFEGFDLFYLEEKNAPKVDQALFFQIQAPVTSGQTGNVRWERREAAVLVKNQNLKLDSSLSIDAKKPVAPVKNEDEKLYFNVNIDTKKFPEFTQFKSLIWTFASDTTNPSILKQKWDSMDIEDSGLGYYVMNLSSKKSQESIAVVPVLEGEEFEKAMQDFNSNLKTFEEKRVAEMKVKKAKANASAYIASFQVNRTGWHNIDAVYHQLANLELFAPEFTYQNEEIKVKDLRLVSQYDGAKSVVQYSQKNLDEFFYIELFDNALLVEDASGNFYGVNKDDFKKAKLSKSSPKVAMKKLGRMVDMETVDAALIDLMYTSM